MTARATYFSFAFCFALSLVPGSASALALDDVLDKAGQTVREGTEWVQREVLGNEFPSTPERLEQVLGAAEESVSLRKNSSGGDRNLVDRVLRRDSAQQRLVEKTLSLLTRSEAQNHMHRYLEAKRTIRETDKEIAKLERQAISAPKTVPAWRVWEDSLTDVLQKAETAAARRAGAKADAADAAERLRASLSRHQIPLTRNQVESLLLCADGNDVLSLLVAAESIISLNKELEKIARKDGANREHMQNYAACYLLMQEAFIMANDQASAKIGEVYLVKIDAIKRQAETLSGKALELMGSASLAQQEALRANLVSNRTTIAAAENYRTYLERQADFLKQGRQELEQALRIAENSYETMANSGELLALAETADRIIQRVMSLKTPAYAVLQDTALRREFESLTVRLQTD